MSILNPQSVLGDWIQRLRLEEFASHDRCFVHLIPLSEQTLDRRLNLEEYQLQKHVYILDEIDHSSNLGAHGYGSIKDLLWLKQKRWECLKALIVIIRYTEERYAEMMVYFKPD